MVQPAEKPCFAPDDRHGLANWKPNFAMLVLIEQPPSIIIIIAKGWICLGKYLAIRNEGGRKTANRKKKKEKPNNPKSMK